MDAASRVARVVRNPVVASRVAANKAAEKKVVAVVVRKVAAAAALVIAKTTDNEGEFLRTRLRCLNEIILDFIRAWHRVCQLAESY